MINKVLPDRLISFYPTYRFHMIKIRINTLECSILILKNPDKPLLP